MPRGFLLTQLKQNQYGMRTPRILWASPYHLLDTSSGASKAVRTIFKQLNKRGWATRAISATVFDSLSGAKTVESAVSKLTKKTDILELNEDFMLHRTVVTPNTNRMSLTASEEEKYYGEVLYTINTFRPDIICLYGGYVLEQLICHEAIRRGIPILFYLGNNSYTKGAVIFRLVDRVITDSLATATLYANETKLNVIPVGTFIQSEEVVAKHHQPKYITFINPTASKGTTIVAGLAEHFKKNRPDLRFLVVQSRGDWITSCKELGYDPESFDNVDVTKNVFNMKLVYEKTKVLLCPSLAYESAGRVIVEAQLNGIPVIGTDIGGIPETIGDGGYIISPSQELKDNSTQRISKNDLKEWVDKLEIIMTDHKEYARLSKLALHHARTFHSIAKRTDDLIATLKPLTDRLAGDAPFIHTR